MNKRIGWEIERIILLVIVGLSIGVFFDLLPPLFAYIQNLASWAAIAYLIYVVSPTAIIFGTSSPRLDVTIVIAYILMSAKSFVTAAATALPGLVTKASSYVVFAQANVSDGLQYAISKPALDFYYLKGVVPNAADIARSVAQHMTIAHPQINVILVQGTTKIGFIATPLGSDGMMLTFYNSVVEYASTIQLAGILLGTVLLLFVAIYASWHVKVDPDPKAQHKGLLHVINEHKQVSLLRPLWVFLLLIGFYVMVFNLFFEWMTITDDVPLLMLTLLAFLVLYILHRLDDTGNSTLERISNSSSDFYHSFIQLLSDKSTVLLGISGLLIMHLLTDLGNYVIPMITGTYKTIYMIATNSSTANDSLTFIGMMRESIVANTANAANGIAHTAHPALIVVVYLLSMSGLVLLLVLPGIIWYKLYRASESRKLAKDASNTQGVQGAHHTPNWRAWQIGLALACMFVFLMLPVVSITNLQNSNVVGVQLEPYPILQDRLTNVPFILGGAIGIFLLFVLIGTHDYARRISLGVPFLAGIVFFGYYIYNYFASSFMYYTTTLVHIVNTNGIWLAILPTMFLLFLFTIIFFVTGFFSFLYEIRRDE